MKQNLISKWSGEYVKEAENQRRLSAAQDRMDRWSSSSDTIPSSATSESALDSGYHIQSSSGYTGAATVEQSVWNGEPPNGGKGAQMKNSVRQCLKQISRNRDSQWD